MTDRYQPLRDAIAVLDNPPAMKRGRLLSVDENMNARIAWDDPRDDFHLAADPDTIAALLADHDREKSRADSLAEQVQHDYARIVELLAERDHLHEECHEQARLLGMSGSMEAKLLAKRDALRDALTELYAAVKGECPSLLDEDRGGSARLDMAVSAALADGENSDGL